MFDIIKNFEHLAARLNSVALMTAGLLTILAGVFVWLGGLGFKRALFVVAGAACGAMVGLFITGWNPLLAVALIGASAFLAAMFEEMFIAVIASGVIAVVGFLNLIRPYITPSPELFNTIRQGVVIVPWHNWVILIGLVILPIVVAAMYWRIAAAISCAIVGTLLLFIGAGLFILINGDSPVRHLSGAKSFYGWLFLAIIAAGTLEQMFLAKTINITKFAGFAKKARHKKTKEDEIRDKTASWRSA